MPYDPRELTCAMGLTAPRSGNHARALLEAMEAYPCEGCGRPVGVNARGLTVCRACAIPIPVTNVPIH